MSKELTSRSVLSLSNSESSGFAFNANSTYKNQRNILIKEQNSLLVQVDIYRLVSSNLPYPFIR